MARMNDGIPMVSAFTRLSCAGVYGYGSVKKSVMRERTKVKIFLTRYNDALRSMLLMTRRPSATTDGRAENCESSSTICDA